jgi:hypothetical protein
MLYWFDEEEICIYISVLDIIAPIRKVKLRYMIWYVIKYDESRTSKSIRPKLLSYLILYTAEYLVAISG